MGDPRDDTPKLAARRERDKKTVSQMCCIYCAGRHESEKLTETAYCGEPICPECKAIDDYAVLRTVECRNLENKTSCDKCPYHCYKPDQLEIIRSVMRYAGPRMIGKHPIAAIRHMIGK